MHKMVCILGSALALFDPYLFQVDGKKIIKMVDGKKKLQSVKTHIGSFFIISKKKKKNFFLNTKFKKNIYKEKNSHTQKKKSQANVKSKNKL